MITTCLIYCNFYVIPAEKNLPVGEVCNDNYDATDGLLCDPSLRCARCSEDQPKTCKAITTGLMIVYVIISYCNACRHVWCRGKASAL